MRLSRHILSIAAIILIVLTLLFAYYYADSLVSYKYEVQTDQSANITLNNHQKQILKDISSSKIEAIVCLLLLGGIMVLCLSEPTFKGKIIYIQ